MKNPTSYFASGRAQVSASAALRAEALRVYGEPVAFVAGGLVDWGAGSCANDARFARAVMARFPRHADELRRRARVAAEACRMRLRKDNGEPRVS